MLLGVCPTLRLPTGKGTRLHSGYRPRTWGPRPRCHRTKRTGKEHQPERGPEIGRTDTEQLQGCEGGVHPKNGCVRST